MFILFLKLLLAHLIGDFLLQPNSWVNDKIKYKEKSGKLYLHIGIHLALMLVFTGFHLPWLPWLLYIAVLHLVIDINKLYFTGRLNSTTLFLLDQALHIVVLAMVAWYLQPAVIPWKAWINERTLLFASALLMVTYVAAVFIRTAISRWRVEDRSLAEAGKYIGMGERLFIFLFILTNHWEGVGFLLAAKSIFRFGDLNKDNDRKLTEYVLIGTLLSFGVALFISLLYQKIVAMM